MATALQMRGPTQAGVLAGTLGLITTCMTSPICSNLYQYVMNYFSSIHDDYKELKKEHSDFKHALSLLKDKFPEFFQDLNFKERDDTSKKIHEFYNAFTQQKTIVDSYRESFKQINIHSKKLSTSFNQTKLSLEELSLSVANSYGAVQEFTSLLEKTNHCLEVKERCETDKEAVVQRAVNSETSATQYRNDLDKTRNDLDKVKDDLSSCKGSNVDLKSILRELLLRLRICAKTGVFGSNDPGGPTDIMNIKL